MQGAGQAHVPAYLRAQEPQAGTHASHGSGKDPQPLARSKGGTDEEPDQQQASDVQDGVRGSQVNQVATQESPCFAAGGENTLPVYRPTSPTRDRKTEARPRSDNQSVQLVADLVFSRRIEVEIFEERVALHLSVFPQAEGPSGGPCRRWAALLASCGAR